MTDFSFPSFPFARLVDEKDYLSPDWMLFFDQLISFMNQNFSNEGLVMPSLAATDIALLTNAPNGTMIYDTTNNTPVVKKNGAFVPFP